MYVRKKKNRSVSTNVVVVDKSSGRIRYLKTIGISSDEKVISELYKQGRKWIEIQQGNRDMIAIYEQQHEEKQVTDYLLSKIWLTAFLFALSRFAIRRSHNASDS